jgi:hypothetical protein
MILATCAIKTNVKMSKRRQTSKQKLIYFCENQGDVKVVVVAGSK